MTIKCTPRKHATHTTLRECDKSNIATARTFECVFKSARRQETTESVPRIVAEDTRLNTSKTI